MKFKCSQRFATAHIYKPRDCHWSYWDRTLVHALLIQHSRGAIIKAEVHYKGPVDRITFFKRQDDPSNKRQRFYTKESSFISRPLYYPCFLSPSVSVEAIQNRRQSLQRKPQLFMWLLAAKVKNLQLERTSVSIFCTLQTDNSKLKCTALCRFLYSFSNYMTEGLKKRTEAGREKEGDRTRL